jgi:5-methyltetrahydrofolate--homocysteine methyltransferase
MEYKQDWEKAEERMRAWLAGTIIDRPVVLVTAPRDDRQASAAKYDPWIFFMHHLDDLDLVLEHFQGYLRQTYFGGEAFPNFWPNLGPGSTAAYMGSRRQVMENTVWFEQEETTPWEKILSLKLLEKDPWWQATQEVVRRAAALSQENFLVGMPDFNAPANLLGFWRGTQTLLTDLFDAPQQVKQGSRLMTEIWHQCYDRLYPLQQQCQQGTIDWMGFWYPGRGSNVQCDFSAMISPGMFTEFVLPDLREQCRRLDWSIYHWDGPGQVPHLDLLLDIPELTGIQWTPGAGNPGVGSPQWYPLYQRIQAKGKRLVLLGMEAHEIEPLFNAIAPAGVLMGLAAKSEDEARQVLALTERCATGGTTRWN